MDLQPANDNYYRNSGYGVRNVEKEDKTSGLEKTGKVVRNSGTVVQAGGMALKGVGVATQAAGAATTGAGALISATGVGAPVGAAVMGLGRAMGVAGKATRVGGEAVSKTGQVVRRAGSTAQLSNSGALGVAKIAVRAPLSFTNFLFGAFLIKLWILQVIFGLLSFVMLGIAGGFALLQSAQVFGISPQRIIDLVRTVTGVGLDVAENSAALFMLFDVLALIFGLISLMLIAFKSILSLESPFWGKGANYKIGSFLAAIAFYSMPISNLFPWVFIYWLALMLNRDF